MYIINKYCFVSITGTIGVSIIMLGLVFPKCGKEATVTLLIIAITLQGAIPAGPYANVIDLSPNFSSKSDMH